MGLNFDTRRAITRDEYDRLMEGRDRPLTALPIQRRHVETAQGWHPELTLVEWLIDRMGGWGA